jgi:hypothetical protein
MTLRLVVSVGLPRSSDTATTISNLAGYFKRNNPQLY